MNQSTRNVHRANDVTAVSEDHRGNREMTQSRHRAWRVLGLAGVLLLTATACGEDDPKPAPPKASDDSSPDAKPSQTQDPQAANKAAAVKAYEAYWTEQAKAYGKGTPEGTDILRYTHEAAPVFQKLVDDLERLEKAGSHTTGKPGHEATVESLSEKTKESLPIAKVRDCLDMSEWKTLRDGKVQPLPEGQPEKVITTARLEDWGKDGWRVLEIKPTKQAC